MAMCLKQFGTQAKYFLDIGSLDKRTLNYGLAIYHFEQYNQLGIILSFLCNISIGKMFFQEKISRMF